MQRLFVIIGFIVGLVIVLALVLDVYTTIQQIMADARFQQFMFPGDQPKISTQISDNKSSILMHAIAGATLIVLSLKSGSSEAPQKLWVFYTLVAVFGMIIGYGTSKALFGVAILIGIVAVFTPFVGAIAPSFTQTTTPPVVQSDSSVSEIERLEGLLQRGLIDQAEFQQLKHKILQRTK